MTGGHWNCHRAEKWREWLLPRRSTGRVWDYLRTGARPSRSRGRGHVHHGWQQTLCRERILYVRTDLPVLLFATSTETSWGRKRCDRTPIRVTSHRSTWPCSTSRKTRACDGIKFNSSLHAFSDKTDPTIAVFLAQRASCTVVAHFHQARFSLIIPHAHLSLRAETCSEAGRSNLALRSTDPPAQEQRMREITRSTTSRTPLQNSPGRSESPAIKSD